MPSVVWCALPAAGSSWRPPVLYVPSALLALCHFCSAMFLPRGPGSLGRRIEQSPPTGSSTDQFLHPCEKRTHTGARQHGHTQARGVAHARGLLPMLRLGSVAPLQVLWAEGATALFRSPFTQSVKPAPAGSTFSGKLQKGLCLTHRPICSFVGCPWVLGGSSGGRSRHLGLGRRVQTPWPAPCSPELTTVLVLKTLSLYSPLNRHVEHHLPEGRSVVST